MLIAGSTAYDEKPGNPITSPAEPPFQERRTGRRSCLNGSSRFSGITDVKDANRDSISSARNMARPVALQDRDGVALGCRKAVDQNPFLVNIVVERIWSR